MTPVTGVFRVGEESASQIKLRSERIGAAAKNLFVLVEVSLEKILEQIKFETIKDYFNLCGDF